MWENCHDYDPEVEAQLIKPMPAPQVDLDRLDALLDGGGKARELTHFLLFHAVDLAAELRTLRARVEELSAGAVELTDGTKEYNDLIAERDRLRAERDAANAAVAGLREALEHQEAALCIIRDRQLGQVSVKDIDQGIGQIRAALSSTPDQHRARIVAGRKRAVAEWIENEVRSGDDYYERSRDGMLADAQELRADAERLERGE